MSTTLYCSENDLINRLSADGINYRTPDNPPTTLGDVLTDACSQVDEHLYYLYDPAQLAASDWVRERAADIASYLLCERGGDPVPPGIQQKYERTMARLEGVRTGTLAVPHLPVRKEMAPVMSNVRIRLDPHPRTVVERGSSTGTPQSYPQNVDYLDWGYDYVI